MIPDLFFDALAYPLPTTLLFLGVMIILLVAHEAYGEQRFFSKYLQAMTKEWRSMEAARKDE